MPQRIQGLYTPPRFGEGELLTACWLDAGGTATFCVLVPLIGGVPQWQRVPPAPAEVRSLLRQVYATLRAQEDRP